MDTRAHSSFLALLIGFVVLFIPLAIFDVFGTSTTGFALLALFFSSILGWSVKQYMVIGRFAGP